MISLKENLFLLHFVVIILNKLVSPTDSIRYLIQTVQFQMKQQVKISGSTLFVSPCVYLFLPCFLNDNPSSVKYCDESSYLSQFDISDKIIYQI